MEAKKKILFIVNPISGVGKQKVIEKAVDTYLDKDKFDYQIAYTSYAHHATAISLAAVLKGIDIVVAVGGDGSINDCVKGLVSTGVTLAIIPTGSGNGLARCLNIPLSVEQAIKAINQMKTTQIDCIKLNDTVYASIAGIGFDALIAREFAKTHTRGFQPYLKLVLQNYPQYKPQNYTLIIDDIEINTQALFVSFSNSNQFGFDVEIANNASLCDGLIDVVIVQKPPLPLLFWTAQWLFWKKFDNSIYVNAYQAKKVRVKSNTPTGVNLDGEYTEFDTDLTFEIMPDSLKVIIP
ncbi:MAG: diacylglycerol/lipid kinase family protein [Candidatus Onthomorpha sp.]